MQLFWIAPILVYMIYFFGGKALFILSFAIFGCIGGIVATYLTNDIVGYARTFYLKENKQKQLKWNIPNSS